VVLAIQRPTGFTIAIHGWIIYNLAVEIFIGILLEVQITENPQFISQINFGCGFEA
jgi:hypothetical protein